MRRWGERDQAGIMHDLLPETLKAAVAAQRGLAEAFFGRLAGETTRAPGIMRDTYGPGENAAHRALAEHGEARGLRVGRDAAANTYLTWPGRDSGADPVLIGSHLDSVPHGGNFDGAAGVLAGLVVIEVLRALGVSPGRDVTVMGVRAEESVWFEVSYIGSRSALGMLPDGALEATRIDTGRTLAAHIAACGGDPEALRRRAAALDPARIRAFLELHIEQAPSLVEAGVPLGICTGIPGNFRYANTRVVGRHDHVGPGRPAYCNAWSSNSSQLSGGSRPSETSNSNSAAAPLRLWARSIARSPRG